MFYIQMTLWWCYISQFDGSDYCPLIYCIRILHKVLILHGNLISDSPFRCDCVTHLSGVISCFSGCITHLSGVTSRFSGCITHLSGVTSRFSGCVGGGFASTGFSVISGSPSGFSSNRFDLLTTCNTHRIAYCVTPYLICWSCPRWRSRLLPKNRSRSNFLLNMSSRNVCACGWGGAYVFSTNIILHTNIC